MTAITKKKTTKKPATKKAPSKTKEKIQKAKVTKKGVNKGSLMEGSTRLRLFRSLSKARNGLSAKQIKEKTGMLPNSGHLAVLLGEEYENGRIRVNQHDINGRDTFIYSLTEKGKTALKNGEIDKSKLGGNRIGKVWTENRRKAKSKKKTSKKTAAK